MRGYISAVLHERLLLFGKWPVDGIDRKIAPRRYVSEIRVRPGLRRTVSCGLCSTTEPTPYISVAEFSNFITGIHIRRSFVCPVMAAVWERTICDIHIAFYRVDNEYVKYW